MAFFLYSENTVGFFPFFFFSLAVKGSQRRTVVTSNESKLTFKKLLELFQGACFYNIWHERFYTMRSQIMPLITIVYYNHKEYIVCYCISKL